MATFGMRFRLGGPSGADADSGADGDAGDSAGSPPVGDVFESGCEQLVV
jgi:hypothetical protein